MPAPSAMASTEAAWKPRSANTRSATSSICCSRTARGTLRRGREVDPVGKQQRLLEGDLGLERVGQAALEGGEAARLHPHAVRDRARKSEQARAQGVKVDGVAIARHRRVGAAYV